MPETRATVSLSPAAAAVAEQIKDRYAITDIMDVVRIGAAVALAQQVDPGGGRTPGPATGTWNLGSLDRDGELRALISALSPDWDTDPALALEALMDKGLLLLGKLLADQPEQTLPSLLAAAGAAAAASSI